MARVSDTKNNSNYQQIKKQIYSNYEEKKECEECKRVHNQLKDVEDRNQKLQIILEKEKAVNKSMQLEIEKLTEKQNNFLLATGNFFLINKF